MHQIELSDEAFLLLERAAITRGFASVEEYLLSVANGDLESIGGYDHVFTPEVIAELDRISAAVDAGAKTFTVNEVRAHLKANQLAWRLS